MIIWIIVAGTLIVWLAGYFGGWKFIREQVLVDTDARAMADMGSITENSIRDALRRHPKSIFPASAWVDLAVARNDWPEALQRAELFRAMFPKRAEGVAAVAKVLALSGRTDESDAFVERNLKQFRSHPALHIQYAENARNRGDLGEAMTRIKPALQKSPQSINAYLIAISLLISMEKFDAAEDLIREGEKAFGEIAPSFSLVPRAEIASHRKEWRRAAELWAEARMGQPGLSTCYFRGSRALREIGELNAARDLIMMGAERFPENPDIREEKETVLAELQKQDKPALPS
jgi:predicted Zn-dependent protease